MTRIRSIATYVVALVVIGGLSTAAAFGVSGSSLFNISPTVSSASLSAPASPPVTVCANASLLTGPSSAPPGAVTVAAGDNSAQFGGALPASTTYWFAPGTHTLGSGEFAQIDASSNDTFIGGPGAILNGQDENDFAIAGSGTNVTIEYLTIENFTAPESQGAVNQNLSSGWTVENSTIENNPNGAGVMVDSNGVLNDDCLTENGQYGFQTYSGSDSVPVANLTITNNEISYNDTKNYDTDGTGTCGCTGGAKFWNDLGATVTGNYIHDNESVGLWMDTNNTGFNVSDNYFSHNWDVAIQYEISYDVSITDNTFVDNGWIAGPHNPGTGAIEINNAGSDSRVAGAYNTQSVISGNVLTDNWGGVDIYDDSGRFCGTQSDNTSNDYCTLVNPSVYSVASCTSHDVAGATSSQNPDYYDNCRWKSQNIVVSDNTFNFTPSNIGSSCTAANGCGFIGLYSEWGTYAPYTGYAIPLALVNSQNVSFSNNTYNGPFVFDSMYQGDTVSWAQWSGGYTDPNSNAAIKPQDAGSSFNGSVTNPTTTTTTGGSGNTGSGSGGGTAGSVVTISASALPAVVGQPVTLSATVAPSQPGGATPTGIVAFTLGDPAPTRGAGRLPPLSCTGGDSVTLNNGVATCALPGLAMAQSPVSVQATYEGSSDFSVANALPFAETVSAAPSAVTISSRTNPTLTAHGANFAAFVTAAAPGAGHPSGTATWTVTSADGTAVPCRSGNDNVNKVTGRTTCNVGPGALLANSGPYTVTVAYQGDGSFTAGSGTFTQNLSPGSSRIRLSVISPSASGGPATITATVVGIPRASGTPTGAVTFAIGGSGTVSTVGCDGGNTITLSGGQAACTVTSALVSSGSPYSVTASYGGDGNFAGSTSLPKAIHVPR